MLSRRSIQLLRSATSCLPASKISSPVQTPASFNGVCRVLSSTAASSSPPPPPSSPNPEQSHQHNNQQHNNQQHNNQHNQHNQHNQQHNQQQQQQRQTPRVEIVDSIKPPKYSKPYPQTSLIRSKSMAFLILAIALMLGIPSIYYVYEDVRQSRKVQKQILQESQRNLQHGKSPASEKEKHERIQLAKEIVNISKNNNAASAATEQQQQQPHETSSNYNYSQEGEAAKATEQEEQAGVFVRQQSGDAGGGDSSQHHHTNVVVVDDDEPVVETGDADVQDSTGGIKQPLVSIMNSLNNNDAYFQQQEQDQQLMAQQLDRDSDILHDITLPEAPETPDLHAIAEQLLSDASPAVAVEKSEFTTPPTPFVDANEAIQLLRELYQHKFQELQQQNEKYVQVMRDTLNSEFTAERNRLLKIIDDRERLYQQNLQNALELKDRQTAEKIQNELTHLRNTREAEIESALKEREQQLLSRFSEEKRQINEFIDTLTERVAVLERDWNDDIPNYLDCAKRAARLASAIVKLSDIVEHRNAGYTPFNPELDAVIKLGRGDVIVESITEALLSTDPSLPYVGVASHQQLQQRFNTLRKNVMRAEYTPRNAGFIGRAFGIVLSSLEIPEQGLVDGESVDARLARARYYMQTQRLEDAIREVERLPKSQRDITRDWLTEAHRRLSTTQTIQLLKLHAGSAFSEHNH